MMNDPKKSASAELALKLSTTARPDDHATWLLIATLLALGAAGCGPAPTFTVAGVEVFLNDANARVAPGGIEASLVAVREAVDEMLLGFRPSSFDNAAADELTITIYSGQKSPCWDTPAAEACYSEREIHYSSGHMCFGLPYLLHELTHWAGEKWFDGVDPKHENGALFFGERSVDGLANDTLMPFCQALES